MDLTPGSCAERAAALAEKFARRGKGDVEIVRLDDRDLAEDPARIEVELRTASHVLRGKGGARHRRRAPRRAVAEVAARRAVRPYA